MEIGPITGIRSVALLNMERTESVLLPDFQIDASARAGDDAYSSSRQTPDRGLEDEDTDLVEEQNAAAEGALLVRAGRAEINLFA